MVSQYAESFLCITQSGVDDADRASLRPAADVQSGKCLLRGRVNNATKFMWDRLRPLVERSPGHRRRGVPDRLDENISANLAVRQVCSDGLLLIGRALQIISTEGNTANCIRPINVNLLRRHEEAQDQLLLAVIENLFHMVIALNGPEVSQEELGSTANSSGISVMLF